MNSVPLSKLLAVALILKSLAFAGGVNANECKGKYFTNVNNYIYDVKNINLNVKSSSRFLKYHDYYQSVDYYKKNVPEWGDAQAIYHAIASSMNILPLLSSIESVSYVRVKKNDKYINLLLKISFNPSQHRKMDSMSVKFYQNTNKIMGLTLYSGEEFEDEHACATTIGDKYID